MYTQTLPQEKTVSLSIGICATTELTNTLQITNQILSIKDPRIHLQEILVATPNRQLANQLSGSDSRVRVLLEERREGKISALNKIIRHTSGDILVLACADIKIARNAIPKLVEGLVNDPDCGAVDSIVELVNGDKLLMDRVSNILWETHNATLDQLDERGGLGQLAGNLVAVRRELVEKLPNVINDDAYMALRIRERGFRVKRVKGARIWIGGPRTPADYIYQRGRVLRGHLQLIKRFGKIPTTFEFEVLANPERSLTLFVKTITRLGATHLFPLVAAGFLELLSFQVAVLTSLTRRGTSPWRIVESTKQI